MWKDQKKVIQLARHEQAVWAVKCIGGDRFVTGESWYLRSQAVPLTPRTSAGSADKSIKLFDVYGNVLQTYFGHTDCVRSITLRTDGVEGFWSAGNDGWVSSTNTWRVVRNADTTNETAKSCSGSSNSQRRWLSSRAVTRASFIRYRRCQRARGW